MFIHTILHTIYYFLWLWLNLYLTAVELRFLVQWFLNINPYFEPFLTLWAWTDPVFIFGRNLYPKIFGIEVAVMINSYFLNQLLLILDNLVYSA